MRGTASNDVTIEDVFVPEERVTGEPAVRRARPAVAGDRAASRSRSSTGSTSASPKRPSSTPSTRPLAGRRRPERAAPGGADDASAAGRGLGTGGRARPRGRRPGAVDGHGRRRDGGQARDRHRRHRDLRPGDGGRRWAGVLQGLADRALPTATSGRPSSTRCRPKRRCCTLVASPSAYPATRCERAIRKVSPTDG